MTLHVSVLAIALALAVPVPASASALPDGGQFGAGVHEWAATRITGGDFVRTADGVDAARVDITGHAGLVIDGGRFRTLQPVDFTHGIELSRGRSLSLYNKVAPVDGTAGADAGFNLYTEGEVRELFASGNQERIVQAFTSADAKGSSPAITEAAVLAALRAANGVAHARNQVAWQLTAGSGNLVVNGGEFDFHSANQNLVQALAGSLVWNGGTLESKGGGGETVLRGSTGIEILGGSIHSLGAIDGTPTPIQYDDRRRLDRDRWTLGKYLALITNGDINIGRSGQPGGPDLRVSDGMLRIAATTPPDKTNPAKAPQRINLLAGAITLEGKHRSTLLSLERGFDIETVINGGTLNVSTDRSLVNTPAESASLWNMRTVLEDGTINLDNSQIIGKDNVIKGGVVNLAGRSAFYGPTGTLVVSGGTINLGPEAFVGAIRGDSKARSPYPTSQHDLTITGGTLNFRVAAPGSGQALVVGTHIGGIYAGDNDASRQSKPTLTIGPGVTLNLDTSALLPGEYTVADFVSVDAGDGTLAIAAPIQLGGSAERYTGTLDTDGRLTLKVKPVQP